MHSLYASSNSLNNDILVPQTQGVLVSYLIEQANLRMFTRAHPHIFMTHNCSVCLSRNHLTWAIWI